MACEPVSRHLRRVVPDAHILWCVRAPFRELVDHNTSVDGVVVIGCLTEWILLRRSKITGRTVDLHPRGRICPLCRLPLKKTEGDPALDINNYYDYGGLLQAFCLSADLTGLEDTSPQLYIPAESVRSVDRLNLPERFIVFHARSIEPERNWSDDKWAELLELLRNDLELTTVEIGLSAVLPSNSPRYLSVAGRTSLLELAEVIRRAILFVGIDSGPAHLANAARTPGVVLLGSYRSFQRYYPYSGGYADGSRAKLIHADGPASGLSVKRVFDAIASSIAETDGAA